MPELKDLFALKSPRWFALDDTSEEKAVLTIDGIVGESFFDDGTTSKEFIAGLNNVKADNIELHINSVGGSVYDGFAIYNSLTAWNRAKPGRKIDVVVDGMAASIASVIAMTGDTIGMPESSMMMIHRPWTYAVGNDVELCKTVDTLKLLNVQLAKVYSDRTGMDAESVLDLMTAETYIAPDDAVEMGFATHVIENKKAVACAFSAEVYGGKTPGDCLRINRANAKRELERALCDAGYSRSDARRIASGQRDADENDSSAILDAMNQLTQNIKNGVQKNG